MLAVDLYTSDIPKVFQRFQEIIGDKWWQKRVQLIEAEIRGNKFLSEYLLSTNAIAFAFDHCSKLVEKHGRLPPIDQDQQFFYPAIAFAAQVLSIIENSPDKQAKSLIGRVRGSFNNPEDLRAMRLELMAATHFVHNGYIVTWPEMTGTGTFDLLVENIGLKGLEVECKAISEQKGRLIHRREALEFYHLLVPEVSAVCRNLSSGLAIVLTLPGRLPKPLKDRKRLVSVVCKSIVSTGGGKLDEFGRIRMIDFDLKHLKQPEDFIGSQKRKIIDEITKTKNREAVAFSTDARGAVIFVLQSKQGDTFLQNTFDTLSGAAKKQATGDRPALLIVGFDAISSDALMGVAQQDQKSSTPLREETSRFINSEERNHIVAVTHLSSSALDPELQSTIRSGGIAYTFSKPESPFWHKDFDGLFSLKRE